MTDADSGLEEIRWSQVGEDPDSRTPVYMSPDGQYIVFDEKNMPIPYHGFVETSHTFPDGSIIKGQFHVGTPDKCICEFDEIWIHGCKCGGFQNERKQAK